MDKLSKVFEFYEKKIQEGKIKSYGLATWLCFRAKPSEEGLYLNLQECVDLSIKIGGRDNGFNYI